MTYGREDLRAGDVYEEQYANEASRPTRYKTYVRRNTMAIGKMEFSKGGGSTGFDELVPMGVYAATIDGVEECMVQPFQGKGSPKPGVLLAFSIVAGGKVVGARAEYSASLHPKANLRRTLDALCPGQLTPEIAADDGEIVRLVNSLEGREVQVLVKVQNSNTTGEPYSKIDSVMPGANLKDAKPGEGVLADEGADADDVNF